MFENEKNKLILGKYKFKEDFLNLIYFKNTKPLKLYRQFLNNNLNILKRIDTTSTRAKINLKLGEKALIPAFNWQEKIVSINNIFAMMLGIIDARNDQYERDLEYQRFFNEKEEIQDIETNQKSLSESRSKILKDYASVFERDDMEIIKETMMCNPSYKNFDNLFKHMKKNSYSLVIQGQLISAYMLGYNNSLYISLEDIMPYYDQTISEYRLNKSKNNYNYQKVKKSEK